MGIIESLLAAKFAGKVSGLLVSKTQLGASLGSSAGLYALLPGILEKDPEAIGTAVVIVIGWLVAMWGRLRANKGA